MQVLRDDFAAFDGETVLTIGNFDGIHLGHQDVIQHVRDRAAELSVKSGLITFDPHPSTVLRPDGPPPLLTPLDEKITLLEEMGLDLLGLLTFNQALMRTRAADFMTYLAETLRPREIWVGSDFAMGYKREGDVAFMQAWAEPHGIRVEPLDLVLEAGESITSSPIRSLLAEGQVEEAARLLGRPYATTGVVQHGNKRGRSIGYPTANFVPHASQAIPADGVYATFTTLPDGTRLPSATNVGVRPTFDNGDERNIESFILDWAGDLYGQPVGVEFIPRLRGEEKFSSVEDLVEQIDRDVALTRDLLADAPTTVDAPNEGLRQG